MYIVCFDPAHLTIALSYPSHSFYVVGLDIGSPQSVPGASRWLCCSQNHRTLGSVVSSCPRYKRGGFWVLELLLRHSLLRMILHFGLEK